LIYRVAQCIAAIVFALLGRWRITGREHIPRTGPAIVAVNHISYLDPPLMGSAIRRPMWFMAKAELFENPFLSWFFRALHAFPVRRGEGDRAALKRTLDYLEKGDMVLIFPEGTRSKTGELGPPEMGVGMLALRTGAPVIPVALSGTSEMLPPNARRLHPARIRIKIGPPLHFPKPPAGRIPREAYAEAAEEIIQAIARLQREPGHAPIAASP
jgi:1-acyl-sn-glycerol-3-phosphate acyltransferase